MRRGSVGLIVSGVLFLALPAFGDPVQDLVRRGWTDADLEGVPALIADDVQLTLRRPSLVRHFARVRVRADLYTENWLIDYPPVAAAVGRELGVFPFEVIESWPGIYKLEGGPLSRGTLQVLVREDQRVLLYASARVRSPWASTIRAYAVTSMRWWKADAGDEIEHDIFIYGRLRSRTARWLAMLTRPFSGPMITRRLYGLIVGATKTAEAVSADPHGWARRMTERSDGGPADQLAWEALLAGREDE